MSDCEISRIGTRRSGRDPSTYTLRERGRGWTAASSTWADAAMNFGLAFMKAPSGAATEREALGPRSLRRHDPGQVQRDSLTGQPPGPLRSDCQRYRNGRGGANDRRQRCRQGTRKPLDCVTSRSYSNSRTRPGYAVPRPSRHLDRALVAAGRELLPVHGCSGLTIRQVSEAAGVNIGMFHYHFRTREAFLRAVMQSAYEEMFSRLTLGIAKEATATANLRAALRTLGRFVQDNRALIARILADALAGDVIAREFLKDNFPRHLRRAADARRRRAGRGGAQADGGHAGDRLLRRRARAADPGRRLDRRERRAGPGVRGSAAGGHAHRARARRAHRPRARRARRERGESASAGEEHHEDRRHDRDRACRRRLRLAEEQRAAGLCRGRVRARGRALRGDARAPRRAARKPRGGGRAALRARGRERIGRASRGRGPPGERPGAAGEPAQGAAPDGNRGGARAACAGAGGLSPSRRPS